MNHSALFKSESVPGQTNIVWQDPLNQGWIPNTPYQFSLTHRPQIGVISLQIQTGGTEIVNSGDVIDFGFSGGRVGVFTLSQQDALWTDMSYKCQGNAY